jgi:hypothetical protein
LSRRDKESVFHPWLKTIGHPVLLPAARRGDAKTPIFDGCICFLDKAVVSAGHSGDFYAHSGDFLGYSVAADGHSGEFFDHSVVADDHSGDFSACSGEILVRSIVADHHSGEI